MGVLDEETDWEQPGDGAGSNPASKYGLTDECLPMRELTYRLGRLNVS